MSRPRHPGKDLRAILREAEQKGWRITKGSKYYMMWCPCPGKHKKTVRITPRSNYLKNLLGELRRNTCWDRTENR